MIFDIHCHILPDVDDGARNEKHTKRMLQIAADEGIDVIVATPHFLADGKSADVSDLVKKSRQVREWWKEYGEEKELYLGNELFYSESLSEALEEKTALTMNDTEYILVEFPIYADYSYIRKAVQKLRYAGYVPILAHVERYDFFKQPKRVEDLVELGAYIQVNASSVLGRHGFFEKCAIVRLLKKDLVHFVGTDAHNTKERSPEIRMCAEYLKRKLGKGKAQRILEENPKIMLRGEGL